MPSVHFMCFDTSICSGYKKTCGRGVYKAWIAPGITRCLMPIRAMGAVLAAEISAVFPGPKHTISAVFPLPCVSQRPLLAAFFSPLSTIPIINTPCEKR